MEKEVEPAPLDEFVAELVEAQLLPLPDLKASANLGAATEPDLGHDLQQQAAVPAVLESKKIGNSVLVRLIARSDVGQSVPKLRYTNYLCQAADHVLRNLAPEVVISFLSLSSHDSGVRVNREIDANTRGWIPVERVGVASNIALVGLHATGSFADFIIWDLAHALKTGQSLILIEPCAFNSILNGKYFRGCFTCAIDTQAGLTIERWTKTKLLPSEREAGLDGWTFGVPIERPTESIVRSLAADIAALGLNRTELLICSSVPCDFAIPNTRIIVAPVGTATLTAKKNVMAAEAAFENLCIFHDRVALPLNFGAAIAAFGDHWGVGGFQSIYIDWARGTVERYSDLHIDMGDAIQTIDAFAEGDTDRRGVIYRHCLPLRSGWRADFAEAHPGEGSRSAYLTGTLYLVKRTIWQMVGQHPAIEWNELEDAEFGRYLIEEYGIPSRVNPHAITVTRRARGILLGMHRVADRGSAEAKAYVVSEPVLRESNEENEMGELRMRSLAWGYVLIYCPGAESLRQEIFTASIADRRSFARYWIRILYASLVPRDRQGLIGLLISFSRAVFGFQYDSGTLNGIVDAVWNGKFIVDAVIEDGYFLSSIINHEALNASYLPKRERMIDHIVDEIWRSPQTFRLPDDFETLEAMIRAAVGVAAVSPRRLRVRNAVA